MGHFKVHLDEGLTETKVLELRFNGLEACVGFDNLFVNGVEMSDVCLYPPVLGMREGAAIGVIGGCRSYKNSLVPDWQGLNWGGTGVVGLGMDGANDWGGRWPIVTCIYGDLSILEEFNPLGGSKYPVADGDGQV